MRACPWRAARARGAAGASARASAPRAAHPSRPLPHPATAAARRQASKNLRRGKGKMRNRRYVQRKGPLVIYGNDAGIRCGLGWAGLGWAGHVACAGLGMWHVLGWACGMCRAGWGRARSACRAGGGAAGCCPAGLPHPAAISPAPARPPAPRTAARSRAFRNLPGVEVASVDRLNLLQLAPGGHLGRFCIWTKSAVEKLDKIFGERAGRGACAELSTWLPASVPRA